MEEPYAQEQELLVKHLIRQFMKTQIKDLRNEKKEGNNSFVFLDSNSLNMLMIYLLLNIDKRQQPKEDTRKNNSVSPSALEDLDRLISENKQGFEEVINLLKEKA
ncbi:hypothetical protein LF817_02240 [Halobacillus sp. A1]|uniref:hypothetical protein n=1 Tax=Halobacillus sp. A1 TaxID=2880262 RepID=UPI0020A6A19F|nr:hypothetical protein [Halobacillus sp. A1]MCP3030156.1 hypothetical protein [Halobacillus sp. A1]